ncbi:MAG: Zn-dependent dipeptidase, microsomal dipeptidase family [Parcubacteria group bacterium GW2011_GWE2_39_37]|uniref:Zn-dependent dipeptidase, microsomal dipeptidase family n=1 Tax=Candidatus Falkowbacteria bacterium GW2011_GWF2_39_8 TaxID=1618642 RepID=A0A0G0SZB8_9BACT|nr:MAG: Zn-dependent dipeptidase, microsomal dipeptidase family [Parcubacteria group bacterium GW2011_GWE2_39_37]KKR30972.1 MAG: Zn-dependent dipeptidase, microsomal dipeptidase family [Candidatus Falkowbacteria bacterium GW2011_GWF2_39_8]
MEKLKTADMHQDTLNPILAEILKRPELNHAEKRASQLPREGLLKLDLAFSSVYRRINDEMKAVAQQGDPKLQEPIKADHLEIIKKYRATSDFNIIEKPEDLGLEQKDKTNIILHLECGDILTGPDVVEELYARGIRSVGPMYNHDNQIGGGAGGDKNRGLTPEGRRIIDKMVELGMIIDTAHANRKTAQDILDRVREYEKVAITHTAFGEKERFMTPELLKEVASRGGVVGMNAAKPFFPTLDAYINGLRDASQITGSTENLSVATDFGGLDAEHLYEEFDEIGKLSIIAEKLSADGNFSDQDIAKIMYGNIERLVKKL